MNKTAIRGGLIVSHTDHWLIGICRIAEIRVIGSIGRSAITGIETKFILCVRNLGAVNPKIVERDLVQRIILAFGIAHDERPGWNRGQCCSIHIKITRAELDRRRRNLDRRSGWREWNFSWNWCGR